MMARTNPGLKSTKKAKRRRPKDNNPSRPSRNHSISLPAQLRVSFTADPLGEDDLRLRKREGSFPAEGNVATIADESEIGQNVSSHAS